MLKRLGKLGVAAKIFCPVPERQIYIVAILVAIAVIAAAIGLFGERIKSRENKTSRVQTVSGAANKKLMRAAENSDPTVQRRKAVQKQLKQLEEQQKAKKQKLTIQMRIDRAGLTVSTQTLFIIGNIDDYHRD